jgi:hypothetical protein
MKIHCTRGFGRVEHPETGEEIDVEEPFETDRATFEALDEAYPGFEVVDSEGESAEDTDAEPDELVCGVNGCSRSVDSPSESCWQH